MDAEIVKTYAPLATLAVPFINAIVETRLKPKLTKYFQENEADRALLEHSVFNKFEEYLARSYDKQSSLATVVFQNQSKPLLDLYIPLTVRPARQGEEQPGILVDCYPQSLIPAQERILLTDDAGMGKSTLLRFLFLCCIKENVGLPVFVELRRLNAGKSIVDIIRDDLSSIDESVSTDFLLKLIRRGDFVFFLDGYDEIPLTERDLITAQLLEFIAKAGANQFILSSRAESSLAWFPHFKPFEIVPLEQEEAFALLRKYDQSAGKSISGQLIEELKQQMPSVQEFLTNPMLVSLLYKAYDYKRDIPLKKHTFYRQVFDALFDEHDLTKPMYKRPKHSGLDKDDFERVLRALGFFTFAQGEVGYGKDELLDFIIKAKERTGLSFQASDFLRDLVGAVPLFAVEGDLHRWKHKSLQEYFAALFICRDTKEEQSDILQQMVSSRKSLNYRNVLSLCYDIDQRTFRDALLVDLARGFLNFYDEVYKLTDRSIVDEDAIELRKRLCFEHQYVVFPVVSKLRLADENEVHPLLQEAIDLHLLLPSAFGSAHHWVAAQHEAVVTSPSHRMVLLDLLRSKRDALVDPVQPTKPHLTPHDISDGEEPFLVDDNPEAPWNAASRFGAVNIVLTYVRMHDAILRVDSCRALLAQAEVEKQRQAQPLTRLLG